MINLLKRQILFRFETIALIVGMAVLAGCGAGAIVRTHPPISPRATATSIHPAGPVVTVPITSVTMNTSTAGWGVVQANSGSDNQPIAYTVDGGHTWYNISPASFTASKYGNIGLYAMSSTEAWVWSDDILWHTADAGAHWAKSTVPKGLFGPVQQMDFITSTIGWMATTGQGAAGTIAMDIWHTTDGGATWTHVTEYVLPGHNIGVGFVNATTGFATSFDEANGGLFIAVTYNAGSTWTGVSLPVPSDLSSGGCCAAVEPPVFTNASNGVLEVMYPTSTQAKLAIYRTTDAGTTWTLGPGITLPEASPAEYNSIPISVTAIGEVFAAATAANGNIGLYDLPFGATSWKQLTASSRLLAGITQLDFLDATHGWAITKTGLIGTTDGGVTWTVLRASPSGPFQVTSVTVSVDPTSIAGTKCGAFFSASYMVTFHMVPNGAGGTIKYSYTTNNGRGDTPESLTVASGQIVAISWFSWYGSLPADHSYPAPGGVMVTSPNHVQSPMVEPTGQCS
jgi:photosystem II stability/assembly factor-like uncharacterized protein